MAAGDLTGEMRLAGAGKAAEDSKRWVFYRSGQDAQRPFEDTRIAVEERTMFVQRRGRRRQRFDGLPGQPQKARPGMHGHDAGEFRDQQLGWAKRLAHPLGEKLRLLPRVSVHDREAASSTGRRPQMLIIDHQLTALYDRVYSQYG